MTTTRALAVRRVRHALPRAIAKARSRATNVLPLPDAPNRMPSSARGSTPLISQPIGSRWVRSYIGTGPKRPRLFVGSSAMIASALAIISSRLAASVGRLAFFAILITLAMVTCLRFDPLRLSKLSH